MKKGVRLIFCITLAWALAVAAARAQALRPQQQKKATLTVVSGVTAERTLRLAGAVRVRIELVGNGSLLVEPEPADGGDSWAVESDKKQTLPDAARGTVTWRRELVFTPLQPGDHKLPVPGLNYTEDGKEERIDWEAKQQLPVLHVLTQIGAPDAKDAHDITDVEDIPAPPAFVPPWPVFAAAAAVGGLLLAAAGWWLLRRPRRVVPLPPHRVALWELDRLARRAPATAAEAELHHRELARVVRTYLEKRFRLPAQRRTSAELAAVLKASNQLSDEQQALLGDILARCDLAKFARAAPTADECQAVVTQARTLVEQTAPAAQPPGHRPAGPPEGGGLAGAAAGVPSTPST
jgi:hypothetical protein